MGTRKPDGRRMSGKGSVRRALSRALAPLLSVAVILLIVDVALEAARSASFKAGVDTAVGLVTLALMLREALTPRK